MVPLTDSKHDWYNQIEGINYFDTYSLVSKLTTVRTIITLASYMHWHLHQLDENNVFLHGDIQKDVYMLIPSGVSTIKSNQVCNLVKSFYGLKQASRRWYERLASFLTEHHYKQATSYHSLFVKNASSSLTILLVYVEDVILAGSDLNEFKSIKLALDNTFKIKYLGSLKYFLGIEVTQSKEGIFLN